MLRAWVKISATTSLEVNISAIMAMAATKKVITQCGPA